MCEKCIMWLGNLIQLGNQRERTMATNETIGLKLKQLREKHNLSLRDLEVISKINNKSLQAYEKGRVEISVMKLQSILDVYNLSVGKFLDELDS